MMTGFRTLNALRRCWALAALAALAATSMATAQEPVDAEMVAKIREEGLNNSKVMEHMFYLTDVHGPRLAGSPLYMRAAEWARSTLESWGLANAKLEPWGQFGRGWTLTDFELSMTEPSFAPLIGFPKAWSGSTDGTIEGPTVIFMPQGEEDLEAFRGKLKDAVILRIAPRDNYDGVRPDATRLTDEELARMAFDPTRVAEAGERGGRGGRRGERGAAAGERGGRRGERGAAAGERGGRRGERGARRGGRGGGGMNINEFLIAEGAAAILDTGRGGDGTIFVSGGGSRNVGAPAGLAQISLTPEHYNRLYRLTERGIPTKVRVRVTTEFDESDPTDYNIVAEIPGVDPELKDQLVMLGAHFDSWQSATGATDNAAGSAVMMEAMRILKTLNVQPRRTIRIGLWGAEESGLNGSREYVNAHFGDDESRAKFAGYYNFDNGTGRIRGVYLQGNANAAPIFTEWLKPFHDLGAATVTINNTGGTDHQSFDRIGLPGFQFIQDRVTYNSRTHHSNMDDYDHVVP